MDTVGSVTRQVVLAVNIAACFHSISAYGTETDASLFRSFNNVRVIK
jgi:hypothetical protein